MVRYPHDVRVVFSHLSPEGNVSHAQYAKLFGDVRELFALDFIPKFKEEVGKTYLLKTKSASYEYKKDFCLGDTIHVEMYVSEVNGASFHLSGDFINPATGQVHATGTQHIVFTDLMGMPKRLPEDLKVLLITSQAA